MANNLFTINPNGIITVDYQTVHDTIENAYKNALGNELNTDASGVAGQLIQTDTELVNQIQTDLVNIVNSFSPYTATGENLDRAGEIFGYFRKAGQPTVVQCTLTGLAGTIIPNTAEISDGVYNYRIANPVAIGSTGTAQAEFICETGGEIFCRAGTLTEIITPVQGWDSVNNEFAGITGYETESDNQFRQRITANWLNVRSESILGGIIDKIAQLPEVISVIGRDNPTNGTAMIDGLVLKPHSLWLTVLGGYDSDIAKVLVESKTIGCDTNGNTTISYYDADVNYDYEYTIERPSFKDISLEINCAKNVYTPIDVIDQIKAVIMQFVQDNPFTIGQVISGTMFREAFNGMNLVDLLSIKLKLTTETDYQDYLTMNLTQVARLSEDDIEINIIGG